MNAGVSQNKLAVSWANAQAEAVMRPDIMDRVGLWRGETDERGNICCHNDL